MLENDMNDFDLLVREALENAEVKAPRGVWKAVSGRLDQTQAAAALWWKWAGAALAAACVAGAGLFFAGSFGGGSDAVLPSPEPVVAEAVPAVQSEEAGIEEEATIPTINHTKTGSLLAAVEFDTSSTPEAAPAKQDSPATGALGKKAAGADGSQNSARPKAKDDSAVSWEMIELEDKEEAFKPHASISLDGVIGGNDSDLLNRSGVARASSGSSLVSATGITEKGSSAYGVPFSIGAGIRVYFAPRLSLGSGLSYSMLTRTFSGVYNEVSGGVLTSSVEGDVHHTMHYIGIPLNLYYDVLNTKNFKFYVYGGGKAEYCVSNKYRMYTSPEVNFSDPVKGLQYSVGLGLGVEFRLSDKMGLYLDPGACYYFNCNQPKSVRTDKPLMVNFEAGLRFNL